MHRDTCDFNLSRPMGGARVQQGVLSFTQARLVVVQIRVEKLSTINNKQQQATACNNKQQPAIDNIWRKQGNIKFEKMTPWGSQKQRSSGKISGQNILNSKKVAFIFILPLWVSLFRKRLKGIYVCKRKCMMKSHWVLNYAKRGHVCVFNKSAETSTNNDINVIYKMRCPCVHFLSEIGM